MFQDEFKLWRKLAVQDPDIVRELNEIEGDTDAVKEAFYKSLEFGTGGLRGIIGAGTNRMNVYTVGKATQGLAEYINSVSDNGSAAIAYDSRNKSELFAKTAAGILAANGVHVYIYRELMPTPMLSFAVRHFGCDAGIVITASHNPAKYNGYKAYGPDGCQLNPEASNYVLEKMNSVDIFSGVKAVDFETALNDGRIEYINQDTIDSYLDAVQACSVSGGSVDLSALKIIYTPLHGSGNKPVRAILKRIGVENVTVVPEQELPDGNFPTAPYPNPEIRQPFELALKMTETLNPDILIATDPDCDRVGIAVRHNGEYRLLSGNDVGALLLDYILKQRTSHGTLPKEPVAVKTIVTSEICRKICDFYGCRLIDTLTGFKFIGEQIALLEKSGEQERFVFGFEESYGYLGGTYVRDKDAVVASMLICEMTAYYSKLGLTLVDALHQLFSKFGYFFCAQRSFTFEGISGMEKMSEIMKNLRGNPLKELNGVSVVRIEDYLTSDIINPAAGKIGTLSLPSSDVLNFVLSNGCSFLIRPSGTEPKIKVYLNAVGNTQEISAARLEALKSDCEICLK